MEGVEPTPTEPAIVPLASEVVEPQVPAEPAEIVKEEEVNTKKRKENPVREEEALEEAHSGRPTRSKAAKLAASDSPHTDTQSARDEAKLKREEERRLKEEAKEEERKKKEEEKQRRLDEKKAKEEEREATKKAKEDEKARKEEEKKAKEEGKKAKEDEKRKAKEAVEAEKLAKEEERKRAREQKDEDKAKKEEEKAKKEEEKKAKEDAREEAKRQKEEEKKAKAEAAVAATRRQSSMLMSFVKKQPSDVTDMADSKEVGAISGTGSDSHDVSAPAAKFEKVGKFLAWMPPAGVVIAPFQKWTKRVTEEEFLRAVESAEKSEKVSAPIVAEFDSWRFAATRPNAEKLRAQRDASYSALARFQKTGDKDVVVTSSSLDRQRKHMVAHRTKILQIDESARPPFFGTLSKPSTRVTGYKWNAKDDAINYELHSDEEEYALILEDEEDLEAASNASEEEGSEQGNEYEFDAFVVPDGTLSEDETGAGDSDGENENGDSKRSKDRSALLAHQKSKLNTAERSSASRTPILTGLVYDLSSLSSNAKLSETFASHSIRPASSVTYNKIQQSSDKSAMNTTGTDHTSESVWWPISLTASVTSTAGAATVRKSTARVIPPSLLPEVAKFVQNEFESSFERLLERVRAAFTQASKKQLALFLREKCEKKKLPTAKGGVWLVKSMYRETLALPLEDPLPPPPPATAPLNLEKSATKENGASEKAPTTPKKPRNKIAAASQPSSEPIIAPSSTKEPSTDASNVPIEAS